MYGELDTGSTTLAFASNDMAEINGFKISKSNISKKPQASEIAFISNDVERDFIAILN